MKVRKSSQECAAHNATIQAEIDLGLSEAWEPTDEQLAYEKRQAEAAAAVAQLEKDKLAVLRWLDPNTDGSKVLGIYAEFDAVYTGSTKWSSGQHTGWKLYFGNRWDASSRQYVTVGTGTKMGITAAQLDRAKAKLNILVEAAKAEAAKANAKQTAEARTAGFIKQNPDFCKLVGHSYYNSGESFYHKHGWMKGRTTYNTAFIALEDGRVQIGSEAFTVAQWTEYYSLLAAHKQAQADLKASFKSAAVVA